jgi:DNA invertase Pin-like site-specific DNA recombinase
MSDKQELKNRISRLEEKVEKLEQSESGGNSGNSRTQYTVYQENEGVLGKQPSENTKEVIQIAKNNRNVPTSEVASVFRCSNDTARKIMREIEQENEAIHYKKGSKGHYLVYRS